MIEIKKTELQKAVTKVAAFQSEQDRIFNEFVQSLGAKTQEEEDYVFDMIFNRIDYSEHPRFKELFKVVDE